jgi:SAM-dependent methyltransferase
MIKYLKSKLIEYSLAPNILCVFEPFYLTRYNLKKKIESFSSYIIGRALDIGCGAKQYEKLFNKTSEYIGLEIETELQEKRKIADYFYDGKRIPFEDSSFDAVLSFQVLEHVFEPQEFLSEAKRVLKPGGNFLITVPFIWDEHEAPNDFGRYSSYGLKHLFKKNNFEIIKFEKSTIGIECIFQLLICQIEKKIFTNSIFFNYLIKFFIISPLNILAKILNFIPSKNTDMYLDNILLAKKI